MLKKLSKSKIKSILKTRELEDLYLLETIERILIKRRGYVFKMPKPNTPVIALMSGGLDTTVVTAILMEEFQLQAYPIYYNRNIDHTKRTQASLTYLTNFFKEKYPKNFHSPRILNINLPPTEISQIIFMTDSGITKIKKNSNQRRGIPFQPSMYANYALLYAIFLQEKVNIKIRNIFGGWVLSNGNWYAYETLTALRAIMLELCIMTKDFSWQFTSLPIEKELGFCFDKNYLIRWGFKNNIPLEKTWSCIYGKKLHCGECTPCFIRRKNFLESGVKDKTLYLNPIPLSLS